MERPSYPPETRYYFADLDNLGAVHRWTPQVLYINLLGLVYLFVGFFVLFKQARTSAIRIALRDGVCCRICLSLLHAYRQLSRS